MRNKWLKYITFILALATILYAFLVPLFRGLQSYANYSRLADKQYANANVRSVSQHTAFPNVFGNCYISVQYDFVHEAQIFQGSDNLNCNNKDQVFVGNTIPLFYDPAKPAQSSSGFGLATNTKQLADTTIPGLLLTLIIAGGWLLTRKSSISKSHKDYT